MALRQLKKLKLTFCPLGDKGVRAAQDLFNRVGNAKARASNPDCDVDINMVDNPNYAARLQVVFANDEEETILLADKSSQSVLDYIRSKTEQKLNTAKLEQAGFKGQKLSSTWHG